MNRSLAYVLSFALALGMSGCGRSSEAPAVTLDASSRSVEPGRTVTLSWNVENADGCDAEGDWSGKRNAKGSATSPPILSTATFQLTCSGPHGRSTSAVRVEVYPDSRAPRFPLRAQERHLVDASGRPFLIQGDTAWSLLVQLGRADAEKYLQDRRARGFNTLLVNLIEHRFSNHAPANSFGEPPFLKPGDFSTPNEKYFAHADWVLERAEQLGFAVLLLPAYLGYGGKEEGWYRDVQANSDSNLHQYGNFVGNRYKARRNIIWVYGGDYDPPQRRVVEHIAAGIREVDPDTLSTAHNAPGTSPAVFWKDSPWLQLDNFYTYDPAYRGALAERKIAGNKPFFLMETSYENEHDIAVKRVRVQAYQALLSGASGQVFGNSPIWHFDAPKPLFPSKASWSEALAEPGSVSMTRLWDIFSARRWWTLTPDDTDALLVKGQGKDHDRAVAAVAEDKSFAIVYVPSKRTIELDLRRLAGPDVRAEWIEAATGTHISVTAGEPSSAGHALAVQSFTPPAARSKKDDDWILILESTAGSNRM